VALTKATIIGKIAEKNNCTPKQAKKNFEDMLEIIKETLGIGEDVMISGFGKFEVKEKSPRKGRNPATGKPMMLRKRKVVTFKCAGKLKNKINSMMS
jgi:integration host factor subunit alpha